jgi:hypothetical protein
MKCSYELSVSLARRAEATRNKSYPSNLIASDDTPPLECYGDLRRKAFADAGKLGAQKIAIPNMRAHFDDQRRDRADEDARLANYLTKNHKRWPVVVTLDGILDGLPDDLLAGSRNRQRTILHDPLKRRGWLRIKGSVIAGSRCRALWVRQADYDRVLALSVKERVALYENGRKGKS